MATKPRKIDDAGEKIGGARKDRWREREFVANDLADLNPEEAAKFVTKDLIWFPPNYAEMIEGGVEPKAAALIKVVRDRMSAKPDLNTRQMGAPVRGTLREPSLIHADYIKAVQAARDVLMKCRTVAEVSEAERAIKVAMGTYGADRNNHEAMHLWFSTWKDVRKSPFSVGYTEGKRADKLLAEGFPGSQPAWRKGVAARHADDIKWYLVKDSRIVLKGMETEEAAWEALKQASEDAKKAAKADPKRPHLDKLVRSGLPDWRGGRDVAPEEFIERFDYRGVEFGLWVADAERQIVLNMAYDSLNDLAHIMGVPPRAMSLDGTQALAFGARGNGYGAAHYEPARRVINMTKLSGAGSLAHEFGHALDHLSGEFDRSDATRGEVRSGSGWYQWTKNREIDLLFLDTPAAEAWDKVMLAFRQRPRTKDEAIARMEKEIAGSDAVILREEERLAKFVERRASAPSESPGQIKMDEKFKAELGSWLSNRKRLVEARRGDLERLRTLPETHDFGKTETDYLREAQKLCGKSSDGYWQRPTEMFARAFETAIFDRMEAMGARCDYLVHGVEDKRYASELFKGDPYPAGAERPVICAAVFEVVEAMAPRLRLGAERLAEQAPEAEAPPALGFAASM